MGCCACTSHWNSSLSSSPWYPELNRRMRTKTTPPSQDIYELAQAAEEAMTVDDADQEIKLDQMNYDADAEAAVAMGLDE